YACGSIFVLLAFVPATAVVFAAMPVPVMGAALFFSSAFVFTAGLQMMTARMLDARKSIVIGLSFGMAVMADVYRDVFTTVPAVLQPIFGNSLVLGTVCLEPRNAHRRTATRIAAARAGTPRPGGGGTVFFRAGRAVGRTTR